MNTLINISQRFVFVKDMSTILNWKMIEQEFEKLNWRDNVSNLISTSYNFFNKDVFIDQKALLEAEVKQYLNESLGIKDLYENIHITESWGNITRASHSHHEHQHPFSVVSGTLFLDNNPDNLNLMIETVTPDLPFFLPKNKVNVQLRRLLPDIGVDPDQQKNLQHHLVLFLSNWHHSVSAVDDDRPERRSIAFNTFWKGRVGTHDVLAGMNF